MTDDVAQLMLEHLKHIRATTDAMALDIIDIKSRLSGLELQVGQVQVSLAGQAQRIDRLEERIARIERRLDLVEA